MVTVGAIVAGGLLGAAAHLAISALRRRRWKRLARILHENHRALWIRRPRWEVVEGDDLEPWREPVASAIATELQSLGFSRLGYIENAGNPFARGEQRLLTIFLRDTGDVHAASRENEGRDFLELETEFSDGHVLDTNNFSVLVAPAPLALETLRRPGATAPALLREHLERVQHRLASTPGTAVVCMKSLADIVDAQYRQHELTRAFRTGLGYVTDEEWEQISDTLRLSRTARREVRAEYRALGVEDEDR